MSNPAPGALDTVRAFVNTLDIDDEIEELAAPADLAQWLATHDLLGGAASVRATARDVRNAVELREALRAPLLSHPGEPLDPAAIETLDAAALRARLTVRFTGPDRTV